MSQDTSLATDEFDLSLADLAALTNKSERTVRRWTEIGREDRGILAAAHTVHGLRFRSQDVEAYLRPRPSTPHRSPRPADIMAAVAAGRRAGERLAKTPLNADQHALLDTVLAPLRSIGGDA